MKSSQWTV